MLTVTDMAVDTVMAAMVDTVDTTVDTVIITARGLLNPVFMLDTGTVSPDVALLNSPLTDTITARGPLMLMPTVTDTAVVTDTDMAVDTVITDKMLPYTF